MKYKATRMFAYGGTLYRAGDDVAIDGMENNPVIMRCVEECKPKKKAAKKTTKKVSKAKNKKVKKAKNK